MKITKTFYWMILFSVFVYNESISQTCDNCGIGTSVPTSRLHIKACGIGAGTSALNVADSTNKSLFFVRDDGNIGIGTTNPLSTLDVNGWQYLRDANFPMLKMSSTNSFSLKDVGIHFDGYGSTPSQELRLGRYNKSNGLWEANVFRVSMLAPDNSFYLGSNGSLGIGLAPGEWPMGRLDVNGRQYIHDTQVPVLMMSSLDTNATKNLGIHFDASGATPSYEFRLGRYVKSGDIWEANVLRMSMQAPDGSVFLSYKGDLGVGMGPNPPNFRFQVRGHTYNPSFNQYGQVVSFEDSTGTVQTFFSVKAGAGAWNPLTAANDNGIYWRDDANVESANGFVIAPWSNSALGIRIDGVEGNVGIGTSPSAKLHLKDGHIRVEQTTAPACSVATQNGITAAALATGSTDTKGTLTMTGDNNGTNTVIQVNFVKTCAVVPVVVVSPASLSAQAYTFYTTAATGSFTICLKDGGTNADPSFNYIVIE